MSGPDRIGGEKNERIRHAVERIEALQKEAKLPFTVLLAGSGIGYGRFMRWRRRIIQGDPPLRQPGPKKVLPLNLQQLKDDIAQLPHGKKRTKETVGLVDRYRQAVSRRELERLIHIARKEHNRAQRAAQCRVVWHRPDLVWAMDGCRFPHRSGTETLHVHNLQDLCACYKFPPLATHDEACGEAVAGHLAHQFERFGPPLFCKRDNGGNVNHLAVDQLLEETWVIPINSPVNTASYNGGIEHSQGEFKTYLKCWQDKAKTTQELMLLTETAAHDLNHLKRRTLSGKTACQVYFAANRVKYGKRERYRIYHWIRELAIRISERLGKTVIVPAAWRVAAKNWMVKNNLITILKPEEVLPNLSPDLCHH